jgi:hypothetical protein
MLENCSSNQADVLSGVPQRTILGPILFLVFINDLPEVVKHSSVQLFADDCILFKHIESSGNAMKLQQDLTSLEESDQQWQMKFHPEKCTVMRIGTNSRMKRDTNYSLHGHILEVESWSKYLGVNISDDLTWRDHIEKTASKANRTVGFLRRNMRDCSKRVRNAAYVSLARPVVEYACVAWDPHTTEDINRLDQMQRRSARFVCNNYRQNTRLRDTDDKKDLNWEPLPDRRRKH